MSKVSNYDMPPQRRAVQTAIGEMIGTLPMTFTKDHVQQLESILRRFAVEVIQNKFKESDFT
jgi:hypothetical protein